MKKLLSLITLLGFACGLQAQITNMGISAFTLLSVPGYSSKWVAPSTATNPATVTFYPVNPPPGDYGNYVSLTMVEAGPASSSDGTNATKFYSLAPSNNDTDLSLFSWVLTSNGSTNTATTLVATYPNAHTMPVFGLIQECFSPDQTRYVAAVVSDSPLGEDWDTLSLVVTDLTTGNTTEVDLTPTMIAVTVSVSGLGIPVGSALWT